LLRHQARDPSGIGHRIAATINGTEIADSTDNCCVKTIPLSDLQTPFFVDLVNAFIVKAFLALPWLR
jgi:hypothetical protein